GERDPPAEQRPAVPGDVRLPPEPEAGREDEQGQRGDDLRLAGAAAGDRAGGYGGFARGGRPATRRREAEVADRPCRLRQGRRHDRDDQRRQARHHPARPAVMQDRTRIAILAGGRSSEHEISLASARSVLEALDADRYEVVTVAIGRDGRWELGAGDDGRPSSSVAETLPIPTSTVPATLGDVDVVLPILPGPFGEAGAVSGLLG